MMGYQKTAMILFGFLAIILTGRGEAQLPSDPLDQGRAALEKGDTNKALAEIFRMLQQQQATLDRLMLRSQEQQNVINQQKELIEAQSKQLADQQQKLEQSPRLPEGFADNYSADQQYKLAYDLQHIAIFDVRRKDAGPYFRKAAEEFGKLVEKHPTAEKADDAQYRIAKIYHRYLKEYPRAIQEYKKFVEMFPESEYVEEARAALQELQ